MSHTSQKQVRTCCVITVSDRASRGEYRDESGPGLARELETRGHTVADLVIVPDERAQISEAIRAAVDKDVALVLTTGGTGLSPRDVTPEATVDVCERMVPGLAEQMRARSAEVTSRAYLSRAVVGICQRTLVVNLPGSPRGSRECLSFVIDAVEHGLATLRDGPQDCGRS